MNSYGYKGSRLLSIDIQFIVRRKRVGKKRKIKLSDFEIYRILVDI